MNYGYFSVIIRKVYSLELEIGSNNAIKDRVPSYAVSTRKLYMEISKPEIARLHRLIGLQACDLVGRVNSNRPLHSELDPDSGLVLMRAYGDLYDLSLDKKRISKWTESGQDIQLQVGFHTMQDLIKRVRGLIASPGSFSTKGSNLTMAQIVLPHPEIKTTLLHDERGLSTVVLLNNYLTGNRQINTNVKPGINFATLIYQAAVVHFTNPHLSTLVALSKGSS